jgi:hypothetical protein
VDKLVVPYIAFDELNLGGNRQPEAGRQIVQDYDILTRVEQAQDHMTTDEACPTGDQDSHLEPNLAGVHPSFECAGNCHPFDIHFANSAFNPPRNKIGR